MDAPPGQCSFCPATADVAHHLTGRGPDESYLHAEQTVDLCHRHHELVHATWRAQDVEQLPSELWTLTARLEIERRRISAFEVCQAQFADNPIWTATAILNNECADYLSFIDLDLHPHCAGE